MEDYKNDFGTWFVVEFYHGDKWYRRNEKYKFRDEAKRAAIEFAEKYAKTRVIMIHVEEVCTIQVEENFK